MCGPSGETRTRGILGFAACCGARCAPCRRRGCVAHRPRPLAHLALSATGSARLAPPKQIPCFVRRMPRINSCTANRKVQTPQKRTLDFWSEWRDSNSRHPRLCRLLRCPVCALPSARLRCTPTAATRSPRFICHRQRSARSPKAGPLLWSQDAAHLISQREDTKRTDH